MPLAPRFSPHVGELRSHSYKDRLRCGSHLGFFLFYYPGFAFDILPRIQLHN